MVVESQRYLAADELPAGDLTNRVEEVAEIAALACVIVAYANHVDRNVSKIH